MENAVARDTVIVLPPVTQLSPVPQASVITPVRALREATPPIDTAVCAVVRPLPLVIVWQTCVASPHVPGPLFTVARVSACDPLPGPAVPSPVN